MSLPQIVVPVPFQFIGPEFQANTFTAFSQSFPSVSVTDDGGWVVVWASDGQDGDSLGIYGQRYDNTGATVGTEFQVNTTTAGPQSFPSIASLADGGWIVTWRAGDASGLGIFGQRYAADGTKSGGEFQVNTNSDGDQVNPVVVGLPDGGWLIYWDSDNLVQDGSRQGIYGQRYDSTGLTVGDEFQVNTYTALDQWVPAATVLTDGSLVVTWISRDQDGDGFGIYGQRYDANNAAVGPEFQINTFTGSDQWFPSVAALNDGGFVVTWASAGQDGSQFGIYGQRYDASGAKVGGEFQASTTTAFDQNFPSVTGLADGGWFITWGSQVQDGSGYGIYGQRYGSDGSKIGAEFQISTFSAFDQRFPTVALQPDGAWVVMWESWSQDGSGFGIFGQRLAGFATAQAGDIEEDNALYASAFLVSDPNGLGDIAWQWQRSTNGGGTWEDIAGATSDSYMPGDADVTHLLRLKGTYQDGLEVTQTIFSAASTPVINVNDLPAGYVAGIAGQVEEGSELTAYATVTSDDDGLPAPLNFSFQWQSSTDGSVWSNITGATNATFTPDAGDVGNFLRVQASYTDLQGTQETTTSAATPPVYAFGTSHLLSAAVETVGSLPLSPDLSMIAFNDSAELFLRPIALGPDGVLYELVANPIASSGSVAFQIDSDSPLIGFALSEALADWTMVQNNPDATTVTVSGNGGVPDHLQAGVETVIASFNLAETDQLGAMLSGATIGGRAVSSQSLAEVDLQRTGDGEFNSTIANGASGVLNGQLEYDSTSRAVGAQDALEALRLAVGLMTTKGTADAYDYIAADFNGDGRVGAQDALEILKFAVGLTGSLSPKWVFVDAAADLSGITRTNVVYEAGARWSDATSDTEISLVGVLIGDVNDSYVPV